ncbi:hypothetical protein JG687_00011694 [Phytophthora cactorum]|uniref:Uncharacterized protein n=1 Tax=Phytophthora cactorum TaxID=29920 RepID=A0A329RXX7_9STRA|nr:hypothetical protein Pcac1_g1189 [Phytophthora cactorum]KAG2807103.1 hypothetical protein PC112_g17561 [Phytophthora cactorum]KAG2808542.1 hypothetical protein PC111_g16438 [Phytophthora cactorum]KAG2848518.1 hypothetical protein PC113_g17559 [Phytophthora cactorum]KAG2886603.1 hypothetical protein PC114_g19178 [Phytophthora cactorum]
MKRMVDQSDEGSVDAQPEMIVPVVSPTREALYGSTGQTSAVSGAEDAAGFGAGEGTALDSAVGLLGGVM